MSKTILSELDGWTPLIDAMVDKYGLITAAIFGRIWRYCQMEDNVCCASMDTIASELNISRQTIFRHINILCDNDFLIDMTPELKNHPHKYADTGKVMLSSKITATVNESNTHCKLELQHCKLELQPTVNESYSKRVIKKELKKELKKDPLSEIFPPNLSTDEFRSTWNSWKTYRAEIKHKLTQSTINQQLKFLSKFGSDIAIKIIDQSIQNGWQGLFEIKDNHPVNKSPTDEDKISAARMKLYGHS